MEPLRDDNELAATLLSLRPQPRPAFAAELDGRVAAGFPRRSQQTAPRFGRILAGRRSGRRRLLLPAGGLAAAAIVAVALVLTTDQSSSPLSRQRPATQGSEIVQGNDAFAQKAPPVVATPSHRQEGESAPHASGAASKASSSEAFLGSSNAAGGLAASPNLGHRDVERGAELTLGAAPAKVSRDAQRVFAIVHADGGIVLSSSVRESDATEIAGRFNLLIPSDRLGDALAALSAVDEVRARHQSTADITAPTVQVGERLRGSQAKVENLLVQLAGAETAAERSALEAELRGERHRAAALRSQLSSLHRRSHFSKVLVLIETRDPATSNGNGSWGASDALGLVGRILGVAAGVAIVALALLAPLALVLALAWLARRAWLRSRRERALG